MAKTVAVLTPQETKLLERVHAVLGEFLHAGRSTAPRLTPVKPRSHKKGAGKPTLTKDGKPRKPTGAAAHKAKKGPKAYPAVMFTEEQQATLAEQEQEPTAAAGG